MSLPELLDALKTGGSGVSALLLCALWWLNKDRSRILKELKDERRQNREDAMLFASALEKMRERS